ncbi:MAG: GNAT family N-acetyltransferase, partial [Stackebrandtia sp.]
SRCGRGYATEAVRALTEFAFTATEVHVVTAEVEPSNPASVRVLEKCGFHLSATLEENLIRLRLFRTDDARAASGG